jgi:hypothetical protein
VRGVGVEVGVVARDDVPGMWIVQPATDSEATITIPIIANNFFPPELSSTLKN